MVRNVSRQWSNTFKTQKEKNPCKLSANISFKNKGK